MRWRVTCERKEAELTWKPKTIEAQDVNERWLHRELADRKEMVTRCGAAQMCVKERMRKTIPRCCSRETESASGVKVQRKTDEGDG